MDDVIDLESEESDFEEDDEDYDEDEDEDEKDTDGWVTRIIYEPWAFSGDLPEPDEVLRKRPELASDPQWAIYLIGSNDGDIEVDASGLTLAEAEAREYGEDEEDCDGEETGNWVFSMPVPSDCPLVGAGP